MSNPYSFRLWLEGKAQPAGYSFDGKITCPNCSYWRDGAIPLTAAKVRKGLVIKGNRGGGPTHYCQSPDRCGRRFMGEKWAEGPNLTDPPAYDTDYGERCLGCFEGMPSEDRGTGEPIWNPRTCSGCEQVWTGWEWMTRSEADHYGLGGRY